MGETKKKITALKTNIKESVNTLEEQPHITTDTPVTKPNEKSKMAMFLENKKNEISGMNTIGKNGQSMSSGQRAFAKKSSRRSHYITKK